MKHWFVMAASAAALGLSGCGGGGSSGSGGGTLTPPDAPPSFTSASSVTVVENTAGIFYSATASDPDGDPVTFSIVGGADAARFTITGSGALQFVAPPNFDLPTDNDGNNVYQVTLAASDGRAITTLALAVTVSNSREGIAVHRLVSGLGEPVSIAPIPGTRMLFITTRHGDVIQIDGSNGVSSSHGNIFAGSLGNTVGFRVMALAPEPDFFTTPRVLALLQTPAGYIFVARFVRAGMGWSNNFPSIYESGGVTYSDENLGWIGFAPDGSAYALVSDGGAGKGTGDAAQDPASMLGKLLHIRRNPDPYAGATPVFFLTSILASGLHQPNGGALIGLELVFADRGRSAFEEVNRFHLSPSGLVNFGWPFSEGNETVRTGAPAGLTDAALQYPRGDAARAGAGVVGGQAYTGPIPGIAGHYVFGDRKGAIWSVPLTQLRDSSLVTGAQLEVRTTDFTPDAGTIDSPVAFVIDSAGVLYVLDGDGDLFRVDAS